MNQKKQNTESKVKEIRRHTRKKYSAEENLPVGRQESGLLSKDFVEKSVLRSCVAGRESMPTCITTGVKTFLKLERSD